jgi:DNA-binding MarR family transcriptional regulator
MERASVSSTPAESARVSNGGARAAECADAVLDVAPALMDALRAATRKHVGQMSVPQFRCLHFIGREPGCCVSEVAAFLGVTLPTASAMVDRLVRAGALRTRAARDDRRRTQLYLTTPGRARLHGIRRGAHADLAASLARLTPHELRRLQDGLALLRRAFP